MKVYNEGDECIYAELNDDNQFTIKTEEIPCYRILATHQGIAKNIHICDFELGHVFSIISPLYKSNDKIAKVYVTEDNIQLANTRLTQFIQINSEFLLKRLSK